jgi:hypothetical protein
MKAKIAAIVFMVTLAFQLFASQQQEKYVVPFDDHTRLYANQIRQIGERPILIVDRSDRLLVLEDADKFLKVSDANGNVGWVEKRLVKSIRVSKVMTFEDAAIMAYLDNPTPVYILDADNPSKHIQLTRSFHAELFENIEREFIERVTGSIGFGERRVLLANEPNGGMAY